MVSCTVSLILRALDRKVEIAAAILNISWALIAFLALPEIVLGGAGVRGTVRETRRLLTRAWIEEITGSIRIRAIVLVLAIPLLPVLFVGFGRSTEFSMITSLAVCVLWLSLIALFVSAVNGVFRTVIYHYARTGTLWGQFGTQLNTRLGGIDLSKQATADGGYPPNVPAWTGQGPGA